MTITTPVRQDDTSTDPVRPRVWVGVDTHQQIHHAAVVTADGAVIDTAEFSAHRAGYQRLHRWADQHGQIMVVGIEQTGTYGAGLTRLLQACDVTVAEINHTDPAIRHRHGKTDQIDAIAAARGVATGQITTQPKIHTGAVEAIRVLTVARSSAVKDRSRLHSQLRDVITTAPDHLRDVLLPLPKMARVRACARLRPGSDSDVVTVATKRALRSVAAQILFLDDQARQLEAELAPLVAATVPTLVAAEQIGTHTAAQLAITAGQNLDRLTSEAAFARLTGAAPIPVSSGKSSRHRLHRGGDRQGNKALHMIAVGRLKRHAPTRAYMARRLTEGKTKPEIIRCLKRAIARETYHALKHDLVTT